MDSCPNCGSALQGPYCFQCGQQDKDIRRFFLALANEAFEDIFAPGGRTAKTLYTLVFIPGRLTADYSAGRRARYLPPIRLYLITSFLFFLFLSLSSALDSPVRVQNDLTVDASAAAENGDIVLFGDITPSADEEESQGDTEPAPDTADSTDANEQVEPRAEESDEEVFERELDEVAAEFDISLLSESANEDARALLKGQARKVRDLAEEDAGALVTLILDLIPPIMFILLPIFAGLLKLIYFRSGRYYSEHLVLALHTHSFVYLLLLLRRLVEFAEPLPWIGTVAEWLVVAMTIWIPLYLFLTLRTYFKQGAAITLFKFCLLGCLHMTVFIMILPFAMLWGFLTL